MMERRAKSIAVQEEVDEGVYACVCMRVDGS